MSYAVSRSTATSGAQSVVGTGVTGIAYLDATAAVRLAAARCASPPPQGRNTGLGPKPRRIVEVDA